MKDRGMMKWTAYKSLDRQSNYLSKMLYEKNKIEKPLISNEQAEKIDSFIREYKGDSVKARFYSDGYIKEAYGIIEVIDSFKRVLFIGEERIPFGDILDLEGENMPAFFD